jgi:Arc/MetJ-type ribon-helix-helix transcriptional regulator
LTDNCATISIPSVLEARIENVISKGAAYKSVSDYVMRALGEVLERDEAMMTPEPLTVREMSEIKQRLEALGYI